MTQHNSRAGIPPTGKIIARGYRPPMLPARHVCITPEEAEVGNLFECACGRRYVCEGESTRLTSDVQFGGGIVGSSKPIIVGALWRRKTWIMELIGRWQDGSERSGDSGGGRSERGERGADDGSGALREVDERGADRGGVPEARARHHRR